FQDIFVPLEMNPRYGDSVGVFNLGINVNVVGVAAQGRRLDGEADGRRIAPFYFALVRGSETFGLGCIPGIFGAAAARVDGVSANEFFLARVLEVLPSRHPDDGVIADAVGEARLTQQLGQVSACRLAVQVVAEIAAHLSAGIRDAVGPAKRLGIQQNAGRFDVRGSHHDDFSVDFDLLFRRAVNVGNALGPSVFVHQNIFGQRVGAKIKVLSLLRLRQKTPVRGEERTGIAAPRAGAAEMTGRVAFVILGQLSDSVMKVGHAQLLGARLEDAVKTAVVEGWQVVAVGVAGAILDGAGNADHALDTAVVGSDFGIANRPVDIFAIERGGLKIDVAEASRRSTPEAGFSAHRVAPWEEPLCAGSGAEGQFMFPNTFDPLAVHEADGLRT